MGNQIIKPPDDLATWLREQIADAAQGARDAAVCSGQVWPIVYDLCHPDVSEAEHIARNDPRTVLAQCDAHEAILDFCVSDPPCLDGGYVYTDAVLARLALAYQHRPGYRTEWRP